MGSGACLYKSNVHGLGLRSMSKSRGNKCCGGCIS